MSKVQARRVLERVLAVVLPASVAERIRISYSTAGPATRRVLGPVLSVTRHMPVGHVGEFALPDRPDIRIHAMESVLVRRLYWYGLDGYEPGEGRWWHEFCARSTNILELGCNIGVYAVVGGLAAPTARYRAVDPHPDSIAAARRNLTTNGVTNVELIQAAAVGVREGATATLTLPAVEHYEAPTGAYLSAAEGVSHRGSQGSIEVPVVAVVDLLDGVDLIKLDIEGLEAEVLSAGMEMILSNRPTIFVEVLRKAVRLREVIRELHSHGYVACSVGESLRVLTTDEIDNDGVLALHGSRDVVLVPSERMADI